MEFVSGETKLQERYFQRLVEIEDLPTFPEVIDRLNRALADPDHTIREVAEIVGEDPSITAMLLKLVNSAFYRPAGHDKPVSSIPFAVTRVGLEKIRSIVTTLGIFSRFEGRWANVQRREFWAHCLATAHATRLVRARIGERMPELADAEYELYVAGLLHDIGVVILDQHFRPEFTGIVETTRATGLSLQQVEEAMIGVDHALVGATLVNLWKLDPRVVQAISYHHMPTGAAAEFRPHAACVSLADYVTRSGEEALNDRADEVVDPDTLKLLGLHMKDVRWLQAECAEAESRSSGLIGLVG